MSKLVPSFPRELGMPSRVTVPDWQSFTALIDKWNGLKTIWYSLYQASPRPSNARCCFPKNNTNMHYCNAEIDKVHFDTDVANCFEVLKKLCKWADDKGVQHLNVLSGRGYHFYVFTKGGSELKPDEPHKKAALRAAQEEICAEAGVKIGESHSFDIDQSLIGDIARLVRVPNTFHPVRKVFCIPVTHEDIALGEQHIRQKAQRQSFDMDFYGEKLYDIGKFAALEPQILARFQALIIGSQESVIIQSDEALRELSEFCKCCAKMLLEPYVDFHRRYHVILAFKEIGYTIEETNEVLFKFLKGKKHPTKGKDNYYSCIAEERQLQRIYSRDELFFSHKKIREEGLYVEGCTKNGFYI